MRRSGQNRSSIRETIGHWGDIVFSNPILNHIWTLLPGFILWQIWKARKKSIFHSMNSSLDLTWNNVVAHIKETIRSRSWKGSDKNCHDDELNILQNWQINLNDLMMAQTPRTHIPSPSSWTPPPTGFVKVNFDGASKGNPGPAGYGPRMGCLAVNLSTCKRSQRTWRCQQGTPFITPSLPAASSNAKPRPP
jgi:hypothetical protein